MILSPSGMKFSRKNFYLCNRIDQSIEPDILQVPWLKFINEMFFKKKFINEMSDSNFNTFNINI